MQLRLPLIVKSLSIFTVFLSVTIGIALAANSNKNQSPSAGGEHVTQPATVSTQNTSQQPETNPKSSTTTPTLTQKSCTTTVLPHGTAYQDASWLNVGQTEASANTGLDGLKTVCNGVTTAYIEPHDAVIFRGTQVPTPTYTSPSLQQYVPTTPPPSHAGCVQAVRAKGFTGDADALCSAYGY
jgi:hypothetical protein